MPEFILLIADLLPDDAIQHLLTGAVSLLVGGGSAYKGAQFLFHREMDQLRHQWNKDMKNLTVSLNQSVGNLEERLNRIEDKSEMTITAIHARITQNQTDISALMERTRNL